MSRFKNVKLEIKGGENIPVTPIDHMNIYKICHPEEDRFVAYIQSSSAILETFLPILRWSTTPPHLSRKSYCKAPQGAWLNLCIFRESNA